MPHSSQSPSTAQPTPLAAMSNSIVVALIANLSMVMLHELGHFLVAYSLGLNPQLHHNFVYIDPHNVADAQLLWIAAAGPLGSLLVGGACLSAERQIRQKRPGTLLLLWMGLHGVLLFLGYLFIAPFFREGDTGKVFALLGLPEWLIILLSVGSVGVLTRLFIQLSARFSPYGNLGLLAGSRANLLILWPVMANVLAGLLHLPVSHPVSLLSPLCMPLAFMAMYRPFKRSAAAASVREPTVPLTPLSGWAIGLLLIVIGLFRWLNYPVHP
ncbi:hypothetical protein FAES_2439 [Fibrella aestuarina BUZ 2]|uniref:Uncharacterized protein n=1 Tax=Fibrella aestuarina BUZ 2 TaxID=1166018 RepID=I0K8J5_9BACT|nr:hypothetical protein [Fibrella aestuarina]CCH00448.1 hypothetical protein FAES_2439 [Fibrella aestuarina BUZ 2]